MAADIVIVGSCMVDLTCYTSRLPKPGETLIGSKFIQSFGGKGANQCIVAAKLGATTAMVGSLGDDVFGKDYLVALKGYGVNTEHMKISENSSSGIAHITVLDSGENVIVIIPGANNKLCDCDIENAWPLIKAAKILVCQFEIRPEATVYALRHFTGLTIVNGAPAIKDPNPALFKCSVLCVNETEAEVLTGVVVKSIDDARKAALILNDKGSKIVIITLGQQGAFFITEQDKKGIHVSAPVVTAVDTTGAGDAFVGALAYFMAYHPNLPLQDCISRACFIASESVKLLGTQTSFPSRDELPSELFK